MQSLDHENKKTIYETIRDYFVNKNEVVSIYLFGSYTCDKEQAFSDIDIGILFDGHDMQSFIERRSIYIAELGRKLRKDIHPVILNLAGEGLLIQVFSKGKCIVINKPYQLSQYKMTAYARIVDLSLIILADKNGRQEYSAGKKQRL